MENLTDRHRALQHPDNRAVHEILQTKRRTLGVPVLCAGVLFQHWSNGVIKRKITFEHKDGFVHPQALTPPPESPAFLSERWNPLNSYTVFDEALFANMPADAKQTTTTALQYCSAHNLAIAVDTTVAAHEYLHFRKNRNPVKELVRTNQYFRNLALFFVHLFSNTRRLISERTAYRQYYKTLDNLKQTKRLVLDLEFGGLGDCLILTSLPRLLFEQHGIEFYLSERSRSVFRHPDIAALCFEMNPYFKGFRPDNEALRPQGFVRDLGLYTFFTDRGGLSASLKLERQFSVRGEGLPEIFYTPKKISGYEKVLVCDKHWYSGEKFGLYNNESLIQAECDAWQKRGPDFTIEYITPGNQDIFTYVDKIYSAAHFVCYLSGGNALAAALRKDATVVAPENLEGAALSQFLFFESSITYLRSKSISAYYR